MPAIQTLMHSTINGSTDLGTEFASSSDEANNVMASASASATFISANGAVNLVGSDTTSAPTTNWNINGGTYFSYEKLNSTITNPYSSVSVRQSNTDLSESSMFGENRYQMTANVVAAVSAQTRPLLDVYGGQASLYLRVSIWDSASAGTRTAVGLYQLDATATTFIVEDGGEPL